MGEQMSMNLRCKEVALWQTPTHITYMCFSNNDGGWEGILYRYSEWVKGTLNGAWTSEDLADHKERVNNHLAELNLHKKLTFSIE